MSKLDPLARIMTMNSKGHPGRPGKGQTMERRLKKVEREATAAVLAYDLPGQDAVGVYSQLPDASADYVGHIALVRGSAGQPGGAFIGDQDAQDAPFWRLISNDPSLTYSYQSSFSGPGLPVGIAVSQTHVWVGSFFDGMVRKYTYLGEQVASYGPSASLPDNAFFMAYDPVNKRIGIVNTDNAAIDGFQVWSEDFSTRIFQVAANGSGNGQFNNPTGIAADASGNWYVTDTDNNRVQKFNSTGVYQSQFGSAGGGDGQFNKPRGICLDSAGNIYVVDDDNVRVQKFNSAGTYQSKFGSAGAGPGQFIDPFAIAFLAQGGLLVTDVSTKLITVFGLDGSFISKFGMPTGVGEVGDTYTVAVAGDYAWVVNLNDNQIDVWRASSGNVDDTGLYIPFLLRTRLSDVAADYEWTNQPAALTEMGVIRTRRKVDLSRYRDIRFMLEVNQAGVAGSDLLLRYSLDASSWTTITGTTLAIDSTGTKDSGWVSIPAAARDAVFLAVWGQDGNGAADPQFNWITAQVR